MDRHMSKSKNAINNEREREFCSDSGAWLMQIPVITTGHLTMDVAMQLSEVLPGETYFGIEVSPTRHGAYVRCSENCIADPMIPECMSDCLSWAHDAGFEWLRFDCDGSDVLELRHYDWDTAGKKPHRCDPTGIS